jgi:hypothetical protein
MSHTANYIVALTAGVLMSTALIVGLFGLIGAVVGTALTTWTTRQTAARSAHQSWQETRRQEFRSAVTQFASALLAYRLAEADHWSARHRPGRTDGTAGQLAYRLRGAALDRLYVLELASDNHELRRLARDAVDKAYHIREADDQAEMGRRVHDVRDAIEHVINAAHAIEDREFRTGMSKS